MIKAYYNCWYFTSIFLIYLTSVLTVSFLFVSSYGFHYNAYNAYSFCDVRDDLQEDDSLEVVQEGNIQALQGAFQVNQMVDAIQDDVRDDVDSGEDPPLAQEIHMEEQAGQGNQDLGMVAFLVQGMVQFVVQEQEEWAVIMASHLAFLPAI